MSSTTTQSAPQEVLVGMGQIVIGRAPQRMRAILGSCIGLCLYQPSRQVGIMAHIVLPDSAGRDSAPGKFADTALPEMLAMLRAQGAPLAGLVAKLAGGANMFNGAGPLQIGDENVRAVTAALAKAGICPAAQDVGGNRGRRIEFDCANGAMIVQCAGLPPRVL